MQWQRAKPWVQGSEQPRGLVLVARSGGNWAQIDTRAGAEFGAPVAYRLPATREGYREADRIRKANARAAAGADDSSLVLPLPAGTRDALNRVCERAGFTDRRELLATLIHNLDGLDCPTLGALLTQTVQVGDLSKYFDRIGSDTDDPV